MFVLSFRGQQVVLTYFIHLNYFKVRGYGTRVKGWYIKVYSISSRLQVNTHWFFFFYLNVFVFRNMTELATYDVAWQPLPINLVLRYTSFIWLFGAGFLFLVLMYSRGVLVCYVYIFYIFFAIFVQQTSLWE